MQKMRDTAVHGILQHHWQLTLSTLFLFNLCVALFLSTRLFYSTSIDLANGSTCSSKSILARITFPKNPVVGLSKNKSPRNSNQIEYTLTCPPAATANATSICPANHYTESRFTVQDEEASREGRQQPGSCPEYFRWIHEDLWPWRETGITSDMVEMAVRRNRAHFRLVIVNGTVYVETYRTTHLQRREFFTQWGILQLLRLYPGQIPDLDILFHNGDRPSMSKEFFHKPKFAAPPPMFAYDGDDFNFDIPFPDWSFWGWPEISIKPWEFLSKDLKEGNERSRWVDRDNHAYWKGNYKMSESRKELLKCNVSANKDSNALIYIQDWKSEEKEGFKNSNLANQCNHRYKIYIEGIGWSVSQKYILSCDSVTLLVKPRYYDFFSRSLMPLQHYWPIRLEDKCRSIQHAVDWGNSHQQEAQAIGKAASNFIQEELQMTYIYDYMFHLLTAYAKLLRYKPIVPPKAVQICPESLVCLTEEMNKQYMMDSAVRAPSDTPPCSMPPPYDPPTLQSLLQKKENSFKQVEAWEKQYWDAKITSNSN